MVHQADHGSLPADNAKNPPPNLRPAQPDPCITFSFSSSPPLGGEVGRGGYDNFRCPLT